MRVYLAAPYSFKDLVSARAAELKEVGITVTSSWLNEPHKPTTQMDELTPEQHRQYAVQDVNDVADGDILVFHTDPTKTLVRAGRHVEFGIAIGIGLSSKLPIFVVGNEHENIFHYLPQVFHFATWEECKQALIRVRGHLDNPPR
jgi:nucleoside 2-deoxyribosyltransferase